MTTAISKVYQIYIKPEKMRKVGKKSITSSRDVSFLQVHFLWLTSNSMIFFYSFLFLLFPTSSSLLSSTNCTKTVGNGTSNISKLWSNSHRLSAVWSIQIYICSHISISKKKSVRYDFEKNQCYISHLGIVSISYSIIACYLRLVMGMVIW